LTKEFLDLMLSLGRYRKEYAREFYNEFITFFNLPTIFTAILKELCNEESTGYCGVMENSLKFLVLVQQYNLISMETTLPLDIFFEIVKRLSQSKLIKEHEQLAASVIHFASLIAHRSITGYDYLLKPLFKDSMPITVLISCIESIEIYYRKVYKNIRTSIKDLITFKDSLKEYYKLVEERLASYFTKMEGKVSKANSKEVINSLLVFECNEIQESFAVASAFLDLLFIIVKVEKSITLCTSFESFIKTLQKFFLNVNRNDVEIANPIKSSLDFLKMHSLKYLILPLIQHCLLLAKLNQQKTNNVAIKLIEYLNKNDEYILYKLFTHYVFNSDIIPSLKTELITLYQFFRGYTENNLKISKALWKESNTLFSLDQPDTNSFLPLRELWIINPALYIDAKGPPGNALSYYVALLKYLECLPYTNYEKFCILSIVLTNYADFIGNPLLCSAGKSLALNILNQSSLKVAYSSKNIEIMKPFNLDNVADRLATCYIEISYNNSLLAMLTFALIQNGLNETVQVKVLNIIKNIMVRMAVNFEKEILGKEEWYIKNSMGSDMIGLYEWIGKELQKAKVPESNKMYRVISLNLSKHLKD